MPMVISRATDGVILYANPLLGPLFGLPSHTLVGLKPPDFYADHTDHDALLAALDRDGYVRDREVRTKKADGTEIWVAVSLRRITFDGDPALLAGFHDITQRKRAEEALRESEERYRALVETSPDGISLTDLEGRVIFCNKQALALLGFESTQEVLGRNAFDLIAPEDRQRAVDNAQRTLRMKSMSHIEYTLVRKDGSRVPVEMGASVVVDAEGKPKGFIGVVRDITERKETEEALKMARDELESRVELFAHRGNTYDLTFRELTVLHLVAEGKSDGEIASILVISPRTASKHMENILAKMGASSRTEVGVRAVREQLLG